MNNKYTKVRRYIEDSGFFTSDFQIDGFVCASQKYMRGDKIRLGGKSFCVMEREGRWFVSYWGSSFHEIPDPSRVAEFCVTCLRDSDETGFIEGTMKQDFALIEMTKEAFDAIDPENA